MTRSRGLRTVAALAAALAVSAGISGCGGKDPHEAAQETIAGLPHLGEGTRSDLAQRAGQADGQEAIDAVVAEAQGLNDVVGPELDYVSGALDADGTRMRLHEDGTVTGDDALLLMMGSPTNWRVGDTWIDLCTTAACDNASAWTVTLDSGGGYVFTLLGADPNPQTGAPLSRQFSVGQ